MPDSEVTTTLVTSESILIDGANGVTSAPRAHFPHAGIFIAIALVVAVIFRVVKRPRILFALLAAGALPGAVHVLVLRGDAPLRRGGMAEAVRVTLRDLQNRVPWPGSKVSVVREDDDVLFPLGRYALPSRNTGPVELELRSGVLGQVCRAEAQRVICGGGP